MDPLPPFEDLLRRVRAGDEEAAAILVRQYEPEVRRVIRMSLTDPRLRRLVDSVDIFQSVLANFLVLVVDGSFELHEPGQLARLLVTMARNKLRNLANSPATRRRADVEPCLLDGIAGREESPSRIVARQELIAGLRALLTDDEWRIAEMRAAGREWADIGAEIGASADAVRKRLNKAAARACDRLGLDGGKHA